MKAKKGSKHKTVGLSFCIALLSKLQYSTEMHDVQVMRGDNNHEIIALAF